MAKRNLMGFKLTDSLPKVNTSPSAGCYDQLIDEALENGGIYSLDVKDKKRALSLSATISGRIKKLGHREKLHAGVRGTIVFVMRKELM